jgi:hypothetical protein
MRDWVRTTKAAPCPICGRHGWCVVSRDGKSAACGRVEIGCKRRPDGSSVEFGDGQGWVHDLEGRQDVAPIRARVASIPVDEPDHFSVAKVSAIARRAYEQCGARGRARLASQLRVGESSLEALKAGMLKRHQLEAIGTPCASDYVWTFPMRNDRGQVCGIRLRSSEGFKYAMRRGAGGVFMPSPFPRDNRVVVVEGPTDCAAVLSLGILAIGRHHSHGSVDHLCALLRGRDVAICEDDDAPDNRGRRAGEDGARRLARALHGSARTVRLFRPVGAKDSREMIARHGLDPHSYRQMIAVQRVIAGTDSRAMLVPE